MKSMWYSRDVVKVNKVDIVESPWDIHTPSMRNPHRMTAKDILLKLVKAE